MNQSNHIKKLVIFILMIFALLIIMGTASALWTQKTVTIYPNMEGIVTYDNGAVYANKTIWSTPTLTELPLFYANNALRSLPFFGFNLSEVPSNSTVDNINFRMWFTNCTYPLAQTYFDIRGFNTLFFSSFNTTTSAQLFDNCTETRGNSEWKLSGFAGNLAGNMTNFTTAISTPFGYTLQLTDYDGCWFKEDCDTITDYRSPKQRIEENITNARDRWDFGFSIDTDDSNSNLSISSSLNSSAPTRPCLFVNVSYNMSSVDNSSFDFANDSTLERIPSISFNVSNENGSYITYYVWLYSTSTSTWTKEYSERFSMNGTKTVQLINATEYNTEYYVYVSTLGNDSFQILHFTTQEEPYTHTITVYPEVEAYVIYDSAAVTYNKYIAINSSMNYLPLIYNSSNNQFTRIIYEWNFSRYIPLNCTIESLNWRYWSFYAYYSGALEPGYVYLFKNTSIDKINNTANNTLYDGVIAGRTMSYKLFPGWFAGPPSSGVASIMNQTTDNSPYLGRPGYEGDWYTELGPTADGSRSFKLRIQENVSLEKNDFMLTGMFSQLNNYCAMIGTMLNTSAPTKPCLILNVTYNTSQSNGTTFVNNSYHNKSTLNTTINFTNLNGSRTTYNVTLYDTVAGIWTEETFNRSIENGSQLIKFPNVTHFNREYLWTYRILGNSTKFPIYHFRTNPLYVEPPTNVICHDYNATTLNISYTPFNEPDGTTYTICYYHEGDSAPAYGSGTYGGNKTGNSSTGWFNFTGLTKGTTYTFAFWTWWNDSIGNAGLSENFTYVTNTTGYGNIIVVLRHENMSQDGTNHMINLSRWGGSNSTHRLLIHYYNLSEQPVNFTNYTYVSNLWNNNQTITLKYAPLFYEFTWNYTVTGTEMEGTYTRILTKYAEETIGSDTYLTFYLQTDAHVYNQYYLKNNTWTLEEDIDGRIVEYSYLFDDRSGYFSSVTSYDSYSTIYFYNNTKQITVEQRFFDATRKISPLLIYKRQYFIGVGSVSHDEVNIYYDNLGLAPTERYTSPYYETIVIYPYSTTYNEMAENITWIWTWNTYTGFSVHFNDLSEHTTKLQFSVYNATNGTLLYAKWVNGTYDYDFIYTTIDTNHENITYNFTINWSYTYDSGKVSNFTTGNVTVSKTINTLTLSTRIENLMHNIFGDSPWYNPTTGTTVSYINVIAIIGCLVLLGFFGGSGHPTLAIASPGLFLMFMGTAISGVGVGFIAVGFFLLILAILYALYIGGKR